MDRQRTHDTSLLPACTFAGRVVREVLRPLPIAVVARAFSTTRPHRPARPRDGYTFTRPVPPPSPPPPDRARVFYSVNSLVSPFETFCVRLHALGRTGVPRTPTYQSRHSCRSIIIITTLVCRFCSRARISLRPPPTCRQKRPTYQRWCRIWGAAEAVVDTSTGTEIKLISQTVIYRAVVYTRVLLKPRRRRKSSNDIPNEIQHEAGTWRST